MTLTQVNNHHVTRENFLAGLNLNNIAQYRGQTASFTDGQKLLAFLQDVADEVTRTGESFAVFIQINRELAEAMMTINEGNRSICLPHVKWMSNLFFTGDWVNTGDAICVSITQAGLVRLSSGQHRMLAKIDCAKNHGKDEFHRFLFLVGGNPKDYARMSDTGYRWTINQRLNGMGYECTTLEQAAIRLCEIYPSGRTLRATPTSLEKWAQRWLDAVKRVEEWIKDMPKKYKKPPLIAVLARASYHVDEDLLRRFCDLMSNHLLPHEPGEEIIAAARALLIQKYDAGSEQPRLKYYRTMQNAIFHFVTKSGVKRLLTSNADIFPITDDALFR